MTPNKFLDATKDALILAAVAPILVLSVPLILAHRASMVESMRKGDFAEGRRRNHHENPKPFGPLLLIKPREELLVTSGAHVALMNSSLMSQLKCHLLNLPPEVRDKIWKECLGDKILLLQLRKSKLGPSYMHLTHTQFVPPAHSKEKITLTLLMTCRQM
jgi:hypothetical protein